MRPLNCCAQIQHAAVKAYLPSVKLFRKIKAYGGKLLCEVNPIKSEKVPVILASKMGNYFITKVLTL